MDELKAVKNFDLTWINENSNNEKYQSSFATFVIIFCVISTTDPFWMISALDNGLFCGISVGIMLNVMTLCSFILFIMCWAVTNSMSYQTVWSKVLWKRFSFLPSVAIIISYVYLCYSCTVDFNPELNEIIKDMLGIENEYPFFEIVLNAVSVIPFILSSHMGNVFVISLIGKAGLLIASCIVCSSFFSKYQKLGFGTLKNGNLFSVSGNCIIQSYGVFNAAAFFHPSIRYIIQDMKSNSQLSIQRIVTISILFAFIVNIIVGVSSYYLCIDGYNSDFSVIHYLNPTLISTEIAKIGYCLSNFASLCCYHKIVSLELSNMIYITSPKIKLIRIITGTSVFFGIITMTLTPSSGIWFLNTLSRLSFLLLAFILPPVFYLAKFGLKNTLWSTISCCIIFVSIPISVLEMYQVFSQK